MTTGQTQFLQCCLGDFQRPKVNKIVLKTVKNSKSLAFRAINLAGLNVYKKNCLKVDGFFK